MSNVEMLVRGLLLVMGTFLLVFVCAAARCAWIDCEGRKRAKVYRDRQLDCLQMLREERARDEARRDRVIRDSVRFGSSNHPHVWRHERPVAQPFDEDFGGTMAQRTWGHHDNWEPDLPPHVAVTATGGSFEQPLQGAR